MSAQSQRRLQKSCITTECHKDLLLYCSGRIGLLKGYRESFKEGFVEHVGSNKPSIFRLPLPLVLAVANTLKPSAGVMNLPIFLRKTPLPSRIDWRQRILFEARSISSRSKIAPRWSASVTGPLCQTVSPLTRRKPPIRSSSSVSIVMFTRINSRFV